MAATAPIDIQIRTKGLRDIEKLEREMKDLERRLESLNPDLVKNAAATKATGRAAATATGNIQRMGIAFRTTLGPIVALYGALNFLNKSLQVASQRQVNVAKLTNGLKNLGGTQADLESLAVAADKFGRATLFDQEDATNAFALLTSFQRIGVDSYERVTKAAGDLATVTGQDLKGAMTQLSKALEDPAKRVTDLARSGTVFTDQQKEQIKVLQESGRLFEAQNLILSEIEKQYGGAAEAAGSAGLAGAMDTLGEATRDFQEALVQTTGAITAAEGAISVLASSIDKLTEAVRLVGGVLEALDVALKNVTGGIVGLPGAIDAASQGFINQFPILQTVLAYYTKIAEAMGQYAADSKGSRNFGANYASQEKDLFEAAGGWTPYGRKKTPALPKASTVPKVGGGGGADKATRELERQREELERQFEAGEQIKKNQMRQLELITASTDLEKERLQIAHDLEDAIERINKTAAPSQRDGLIADAEALAGIKDAMALVNSSNFIDMSEWFDEQSSMVQELSSEYDSLALSIATSMTDAFGAVIDGSKSAQEAFSDMLKGMADALINYATQAIAQYIAIGIAKAFAGMAGGGGGGYQIPDGAMPMTRLPMMGYANGGTPPMNEPSIVGERGPELFIPNTAGRVVSNEAMGSYTPGGSSGGVSQINMSFQTTKFMDREWVDREQLEGAMARTRKAAAADGAKAGEGANNE